MRTKIIIYEIIKKYENEMIIYEYKNNNVCFNLGCSGQFNPANGGYEPLPNGTTEQQLHMPEIEFDYQNEDFSLEVMKETSTPTQNLSGAKKGQPAGSRSKPTKNVSINVFCYENY